MIVDRSPPSPCLQARVCLATILRRILKYVCCRCLRQCRRRLGGSGMRVIALVFMAAVSICACTAVREEGHPAQTDMSVGPCGEGATCPDRALCIARQCVAFDRTCSGDRDCGGDTYCACETTGDGGVTCGRRGCVPWGIPSEHDHDESCRRDEPSQAMPILLSEECTWNDPNGVVVTPLVAEVDGISPPEIIVATDSVNHVAQVVALHSDTCKPLWSTTVHRAGAGGGLAVADLDGDRRAEILLAADVPATVTIVNSNGVATTFPGAVNERASPTIADVSGTGTLAAAFGNRIWALGNGAKGVVPLFSGPLPGLTPRFEMTVFADLDADGRPELITGIDVFDGESGTSKRPAHLIESVREIYPAIADMNGDGLPDIISVQPRGDGYQLSVFDYKHDQYLAHMMLASPAPRGAGGPPLIDDFDGDGVPDIAIGGDEEFCVYSLRCLEDPGARPKWCDPMHPGAIWCAMTQDRSSGVCGATSFDFDEDGFPEIVHRDECWLRIFDGRTGEVRAARPMSSGTLNDFPVVADVDGDGEAEIVVPATPWQSCPGTPEPATNTPWTAPPSGIIVLGSGGRRWPAARPLWSSASYHVTEIGDDLSVPRHEPESWRAHNTYRRNLNPMPVHWTWLPDLTAGDLQNPIEPSGGTCDEWQLSGAICNRGMRAAPAGVPATFYAVDPSFGHAPKLCTAHTDVRLDAGRCLTVTCTAMGTGAQPTDLWFRVNDDGASPMIPECKDWNNTSVTRSARCTALR